MSPARGVGEEAWVGLARAIAKRSEYTRAEIECYANVTFIGNNFDVMHRSLESITRIDHSNRSPNAVVHRENRVVDLTQRR
jgi:hypothetical protein